MTEAGATCDACQADHKFESINSNGHKEVCGNENCGKVFGELDKHDFPGTALNCTKCNYLRTKCNHTACTATISPANSSGICSNCNDNNKYQRNASSTHKVVCGSCGTVIEENETHSYNNGKCECGAEDPNATTPPSGPSTGTTCKHPNCNKSVTEEGDLCDDCSKATPNYMATSDLKNHVKICGYNFCNSDLGSKPEPHKFDGNGQCTVCKYKDCSSGGESSSSSSNATESSSSSSSSDSSNTTETLPPSTVVTTGGKQISSSISTVNNAAAVGGMAVATPKQEIRNALGITDNTTSTSLYVCNSNKSKEKFIKSALESNGRKVYSSFNADMYSISKNGKIEKIHSSEKPVTLIFAIPAALQNKKFSIIAFNNKTGEFVEFKDLDNDSKTITIDATVFGIFTLVIDEN